MLEPQQPYYNHGYAVDDDPFLQGCQLPLKSTLKVQAAAGDPDLRRSSRLGAKEAAGKKVGWDPVTQEPLRYQEVGPLLDQPATRLGERLARQPTSSTSSEPSVAAPPSLNIPAIPSTRPTPALASAPDLSDSAVVPALQPRVAAAARRGPATGADYGRVPERALKMPRSFETRPFRDLEHGTTNEDEPPAQTMPSNPILEVVQRAIENAREAEKHLDQARETL